MIFFLGNRNLDNKLIISLLVIKNLCYEFMAETLDFIVIKLFGINMIKCYGCYVNSMNKCYDCYFINMINCYGCYDNYMITYIFFL